MNTFESQQFREDLVKKVKESPKEKRGVVLDEAKEKSEYWQARTDAIKERQDEEEIDDGLGILIKKKTLYHGSPNRGIETITEAENDTVGSGVYFTSESKDAINYARFRTKSRGKEGDKPVIYEVAVENMKLLDLRKTENLLKILPGLRRVLQEKRNAENIEIYKQWAIDAAVEEIDKRSVKIGQLKKITANVGRDFSEYVKSLGYEGLITIEGGEGEKPEDHDTYLIFGPERARIIQEHIIKDETLEDGEQPNLEEEESMKKRDALKIAEIRNSLGIESTDSSRDVQREVVEKIEDALHLDLREKVELLLVLGGYKKANEQDFESEEWYDDQSQMRVDDEKMISYEKLLGKADLVFEKRIDITESRVRHEEDDYKDVRNIERVRYIFARTEDGIEMYKKAEQGGGDEIYGEVYGFPKTSIEAFGKPGGIIEYNELPDEIRKSEAYAFLTFKLSREKYQEEFETAKKWADFVKRNSPKIYQEYVEWMNNVEGR